MEKQMNSSMYDQESTWSKDENKLFERALAHVPENIPGRWDEIAKAVPGKTAEQVRLHFEVLLNDLDEIEAGHFEIPSHFEIPRYTDDYAKKVESEFESRSSRINVGATESGFKHGAYEKKRGSPWSEEEHRNFLMGLKIYGKGDWRSISRNVVKTRTPTQVASHAQKYYIRQSSQSKKRKRASIHDITTTNIKVPPTNIGVGGGLPLQMGDEYVNKFGYPN